MEAVHIVPVGLMLTAMACVERAFAHGRAPLALTVGLSLLLLVLLMS